ncbi:MAG: response regulator [Lachnospiraceae bacterium]|nr:response regulator [Lachnospiraceae bacterium]
MKFSEKMVTAVKPFFILFLAVSMLMLILYSCSDNEKPVRFDREIPMEDWTVTDPEGNEFSAGSSYRFDGDVRGTFTMTSTLPDNIRQGDQFCVVIGGDASIYIDGKLRKDFIASRDIPLPGGCVKRFYMLTPLYPSDSGAKITFVRVDTTRGGVLYQNTVVASYTGLYSYLMSRYGLSFMLAMILLIFSLVTVVVSIVMRFLYRRPIEMLYGGMAILVISAWLITNSYLYPFVYGHYHIDGILNYLFCLMMPFNLAFYLNGLQHGRYRKIMAGVLLSSVASCIVWPILHFSGIFSFPKALFYIDGVLALQVLAIMVVLVYETICGNIKEYKYTAVGFVGFLLCSIFEIVILNFLPIIQDDIPMLIGLAFLLTLAVVQQIHDLKKLQEESMRAVDISEAKTRFLASMSHEIRTPINAVLGMNEMILRENKDPVIGEYASSVRSSGQMLLMLVNDVLDFSKIEAGKMEINEAPYRMSELLRSIMPMLKEQADEKELRLKTLILRDIPDGQISDEFRIRQILINLINNAIKYTDHGSVTLMVDGENLSSEKMTLRLIVRDTGRGISEEGQKHLFEAFTRADVKKNGSIEGTGLGLAIVKSILDSLGGTVSVTSKEGEGSEFLVRIPVGISDPEPLKEDFMKQSSPAVSGEKGCDYRAPEAKLLVVDDNHSNLKLVGLFLKRAGIVPETCDSGKKAIEKCRSARYDLILLDHMMPELDGIETLHRIRTDEDSQNRNVPVIVLTANAVAGSRQIYLDAGFADYLTKPIDSRLLEQTVKKFLPEDKVLPVEKEVEQEKESSPLPDPGIKASEERTAAAQSLKEKLSVVEDLDYDTALRYAGGMEDLLLEMLKTITEEGDENVRKMRTALDTKELKTYAFIAHSVKGQMASAGLAAFSERAKKHETAAKSGDLAFLTQDSEAFFTKYLEICGKLELL